ncbi:MAG: hypothetical protein M1838_005947 [Thelocarpon superellum]|nr:MAG: hypothetical protein M1838_005947 [Thelocarpon superellum]
MAKTATLKKHKPAVHSRAARRATSPSIDVDKSLTSIKAPPESADHRPSVLALHHGAGVMKKTKRGRAVSSKARKRQEKGLERAELVMDRMEKKVEKSVERARSVKARRVCRTPESDPLSLTLTHPGGVERTQ